MKRIVSLAVLFAISLVGGTALPAAAWHVDIGKDVRCWNSVDAWENGPKGDPFHRVSIRVNRGKCVGYITNPDARWSQGWDAYGFDVDGKQVVGPLEPGETGRIPVNQRITVRWQNGAGNWHRDQQNVRIRAVQEEVSRDFIWRYVGRNGVVKKRINITVPEGMNQCTYRFGWSYHQPYKKAWVNQVDKGKILRYRAGPPGYYGKLPKINRGLNCS